MNLDDFLKKLDRVLATRRDMFVIARTDATDLEEIILRAKAFEAAGADAILADGIKDLNILKTLKTQLTKPLVFNQIAGGKSPTCNLSELKDVGVSLVNYSTPCLFAAQAAIEDQMKLLREEDGFLLKERIGVPECNRLLKQNLANRDN